MTLRRRVEQDQIGFARDLDRDEHATDDEQRREQEHDREGHVRGERKHDLVRDLQVD